MDRRLIYNEIANAITAYDATIYVTQKYEPIPKTIPCAFIEQISKVRTWQYADLENTDEQHRLTFEVQVFERSLDGAYSIMETVESAFKSLSFFEEFCSPIDNADQSVTRIVARFSAQMDDKDNAWNDPSEEDGGTFDPWTE